MRTLKFTKMQGAGNDFVMLDGIRQDIEPTPALIRYLADRRFGIGADQVLMVERARLPGVDFRYRIFNCDGDEVEQCGNGARCFAVFVREEGLTDKTSIRVETMKAVIEPEVRPDGRVTVNMGPARKAPEVLPFVPEGLESGTEGASRIYHAHLSCSDVWFSALSMGNPHAVIRVEDVDAASVAEGKEFADYQGLGYRQILHMTHAEVISEGFSQNGQKKLILFDYNKRSLLTGNALVREAEGFVLPDDRKESSRQKGERSS